MARRPKAIKNHAAIASSHLVILPVAFYSLKANVPGRNAKNSAGVPCSARPFMPKAGRNSAWHAARPVKAISARVASM